MVSGCAGGPQPQVRERRWSAAKARAWGARTGWLIGANYTPRSAINQLEMWQADTFDPGVIDQELGWARDLGFNCMRVYLHDLAYAQDPDGFLKRVDSYLSIARRHGVVTILVPLDDVWHPLPKSGRQPQPTPGVHNSGWLQSPGRTILGEPARHDSLRPYMDAVLTRFDNDPRVVAFELYNEPGNYNRNAYGEAGQNIELPNKEIFSAMLLKKVFAWAREISPVQPVFCSAWKGGGGRWTPWIDDTGAFVGLDRVDPLDRIMFENSDIIGYHCYDDAETHLKEIAALKSAFDRPLICTEYMRRPVSTFTELLPALKRENVSAINWGLVSGKSQTIYAWDTWQTPHRGPGDPDPWFHDVLRPDGRPYDEAEAALIRSVTRGAKRGL